ncbi:hypothetical protein [Planktothrix phage Pra-JY27]|nr:hypothetical protein [Planktothrix phage Pag-Yong1]WEV89193.1 hypothetical protein [Synechococcus phage MinM2]
MKGSKPVGMGGMGGGATMAQPRRSSRVPGLDMPKPGGAPKGKGGQRAGMPNFKSRISKPGGMKKGGPVHAGQGSGVGRLKRSK